MKKIPSNVPVFIQDVESQENGRYSTAKLKVFYQGETADHRLFTKTFSDKVIQSLPSTPVVGYYSEESDDFIGHNTIQYVYGHVPETASIEYVKDEESGNTFVITDVILYTERHDNIGEVARKIVGKQHSLELDPDTLQYKVNRDKNGRFLNIEFLDGQFIGLSVLGDNETPAFTGSCFFTTNEDFKSFASKCHENFDKFLTFLDKSGGEIEVFNSVEFFSKAGEFLAKTMQEFQEDIYRALESMGLYGWVCENTTEYAVVYQYNDQTDSCEYLKYEIATGADGKMSLVNPVPVRARFLTDEQLQLLESNGGSFVQKNVDDDDTKPAVTDDTDPDTDDTDDDKDGDMTVKEDEEVVADDEDKKTNYVDGEESKKKEEEEPLADAAKDDDKSKCASGAEEDDKNKDDEGATDGTDPEQKEEEKKPVGNAAANSGVTALTDAERAELEQYRKAAKIAVIDSYKEDLDEAILNKYYAVVDNYSKNELEAALAIEFRNFVKSKPSSAKIVNAFSTITGAASYDENNAADVIKKYKRN